MTIRQLPDDLVNKIAAGEVVERPASVAKELIENALDAGATRIAITTAGGGVELLRIADNGSGMDSADLALSVERHATSKLDSGALDDIRTLGFRGEALASIGSVAKLTISSRLADADAGSKLEIAFGHQGDMEPTAMNPGTIVEVGELFAQVPARRKFLKTQRSETAAITDIVKRLAMANPDVHFILEGADRQSSNWPGETGPRALASRVASILGSDFSDNAIPLAHARGSVVVAGLAALPTYSRANSLSQFFFVNGRAVRDKILLGAAKAAYQDFLFRGRFPVLALFVAVDPADVDVNVHPAKTELRFRDPGGVRSAVVKAIGLALAEAGYKASSHLGEKVLSAFSAPQYSSQAAPQSPQSNAPASYASASNPSAAGVASGVDALEPTMGGLSEPSARMETPWEAPDTAEKFPLGVARAQVFENFIIAQNSDGLVLIDQHAAHERLVYERFRAQLADGPVAGQMHLIPAVVELPDEDCARLEAASDELESLGLYLERFGPRAVAVRETPALLGQTDIAGLVRDVADALAEWGHAAPLGQRLDSIIGRMACHGSVRSGRRLKGEEMNALLREMEATPHSGQCIHGRPTYVELKKDDIERLFGRD